MVIGRLIYMLFETILEYISIIYLNICFYIKLLKHSWRKYMLYKLVQAHAINLIKHFFYGFGPLLLFGLFHNYVLIERQLDPIVMCMYRIGYTLHHYHYTTTTTWLHHFTTPSHHYRTSSFPTISIRDTPTKLLKYFITSMLY